MPPQAEPPAGRLEGPGPAAWFLAAWALLLLLAPPAHNAFWGVNGFRSLPADGRLGLALAAAAIATLPLLRARSRGVALGLALVVALLIAFPLRERLHVLGDTQVRLRAMAIFTGNMISASITEWSTRLHANPLDILVDFLGPIGLQRLGVPLSGSVSIVSAILAMVFFTGVWRLTGRLDVAGAARLPLGAALALAGTLQAFAGYAESAGLVLAAAAWWWAEMLAPLDRPRQAARTAAAWLALVLSHRLGLVMLLPMAWRALGAPLPGDRREARRWLALLIPAAVALAALAMLAGAGGRQLGTDARDMLGAVAAVPRTVPFPDYLNTLALVAPLAFLAPWLAGWRRTGGFLREPRARLLLAAAVPLVPLAWLIPASGHGLGAHRDWDLAALAGFTLATTAAALLARLPEGRLRGALLLALPLLALQAGGWLATNASEPVAWPRVRALVERPPGLAGPHLSQLHGYLGQRAMDLGAPRLAAPEFERSFELNRNPRRAFLAAEAWVHAGDLARARSALARGRAAGPLSPALVQSGLQLDLMVERLAADSARAAGGARPGPP